MLAKLMLAAAVVHVSSGLLVHRRRRPWRPSASALSASAAPRLATAQSKSSADDRNVDDWHMRRDEWDEWLDGALMGECGGDGGDVTGRRVAKPSVFDVASSIVEHFVGGSSIARSSSPLLRRVDYEHADGGDGAINTRQLSEGMFAPLFGVSPQPGPSTTSSTADNVNAATAPLSDVATGRTPRRKGGRINLKLTVAYRGVDFCGWEYQRRQPLPSVQGTLADILGPYLGNDSPSDENSEIDSTSEEIIDGRERQRRSNKKLFRRRGGRSRDKPLEIKVAGRTDRGVSAIGQVCRIRTLKEIDGVESLVEDLVNRSDVGVSVTNVERVGDDFHPSFGASRRAYAYLVDIEGGEDDDGNCNDAGAAEESSPSMISCDVVPKLDKMLRALEGRELDYLAFSHGKVKTQTTLCTLYHSRAGVVELAGHCDDKRNRRAVCFELIGDRFLRRMVRILVATALGEAHRAGDDDDCEGALLNIMRKKDRKLRSRAAPPDGLLFVRAEFQQKTASNLLLQAKCVRRLYQYAFHLQYILHTPASINIHCDSRHMKKTSYKFDQYLLRCIEKKLSCIMASSQYSTIFSGA